MPHEKGFKTSFVVAAQLIDEVRRCQQRIESLFGVRLYFVETNPSHADRWIEVYDAESQDICTKVTAYVKAICTPETESVHRCSAEAHRSIFEGGRRDVLEREYAILIEELNSRTCTLRARGSELSVALALSAIDNNAFSSREESTAPTYNPTTYNPGPPAASDAATRLQDLQKRGDSGSPTSGSESPTFQPRQPPSAEPKNGVRSRMAANLSSTVLRGEVEADNDAEMKILPPSRPKPTRHKGSFAAANVSGSEHGRASVTPTESRAETVPPAREDAAVGGTSGGSSYRPDATSSGSSNSGLGSASARVTPTGGSGTAGSDRVLPLSDLSDQKPDDSTNLVNAAIAAGCDELSIAVVLSQFEHDQPDRRWTPDEFVRAVQENAKQQIRKDHYGAASTAADRNAVAASGSTSSAGANPTLAEAARRLPMMLPRTNADAAGYDTAPLLARPTTTAAAAGYGGNIKQPVPAPRWDASGSVGSNSGPLVGTGSAIHGPRHGTYPPVRSPTVGSQPLFFLEVTEKAGLRDPTHNAKLSYGSRLPLRAPSEFSVRGMQPERMQQPPLHPVIPVVGSTAGTATQPAPLPPQKRHVPPSVTLAHHQSQAPLSESRSSPAALSSTEGKASGSNAELISFALEQGYDPVIVHEVAARLGSTARIGDFMQAVRIRAASVLVTESAAATVATAQMTKSRSVAPPPSKKGTDVIAFAKDCGYSEEQINAARLDIGDNPTPQELLAALKKRSEAVRINVAPSAATSSGSNSDTNEFAKRFDNSAHDIKAARQDRGENAALRELPAAKRSSEASKVATNHTTKALPVRSDSDVRAFAKDYGYSEEEINAASRDIGDNRTPQELLAALKRRLEASNAAAGSPATTTPLRPQGSADLDWPLPSRSRPVDVGSRAAELEPIGWGARGSPLKQGKGDGAAAAAPPPPPPVGSRKTAASAAVGGSAGGRVQSTNTSATRDQMPASSTQSSNRRRIVIDGSNVAMFKSDGIFRCRNIQICVNYFLKKGHTDITVVVPQHRRWDSATVDAHILEDLQKKNVLVYQPSKKLPNMPSIRPYDDKLILDIAANYDGVVISNDNYKDLLNDTPERDFIIRNRVIMFTIVGDDMFYINDDPMGKGGPTLEKLLTAT